MATSISPLTPAEARAHQHATFGKPDQSARGRRYQIEHTAAAGPDTLRLALYTGFYALIGQHVCDEDDTLDSNAMREDLDRLVRRVHAAHPGVDFDSVKNASSACYAVARRHGVLSLIEKIASTDLHSGNTSGKRASLDRVDRVALERAERAPQNFLPGAPARPMANRAHVVAAREVRQVLAEAGMEPTPAFQYQPTTPAAAVAVVPVEPVAAPVVWDRAPLDGGLF